MSFVENEMLHQAVKVCSGSRAGIFCLISLSQSAEKSISSVCIDSGVPSTTILRWIARLEGEGLVYRLADTADARRRYVRMTKEGRIMMQTVLEALSSHVFD